MIKFSNNAEINYLINQYVKKCTYDKIPEDSWDCEYLNNLDREKEAEKIANFYFKANDYNSIGGPKNRNNFIKYISMQIDKLIPLFVFMNTNMKFQDRYNAILARRIFITKGKDYFPITQNLIYKYDHDFSKENEYIKKTLVTEKQLEYLKKIAEEQGFQIINEEYLSRDYASNIISFISGKSEIEPRIFGFFVITI